MASLPSYNTGKQFREQLLGLLADMHGDGGVSLISTKDCYTEQ